MNKKIWSYILLGLIAISFLLTVLLFVGTGVTVYELDHVKESSEGAKDPIVFLGAAFTVLGVWGGFVLLGGSVASVGFISSLANIKISSNTAIRRISFAALYLFSAVVILLAFVFVYFFILAG